MTAEAVDFLVESETRARKAVAALGEAMDAVRVPASPQLARAVQAQRNLYSEIESEFGMLSSSQAGERMGSRSSAKRNLAIAARKSGRLLGIQRGAYVQFPGFQFDDQGARPMIEDLIQVGNHCGRTEEGLVQWLVSPTTYLDGRRPVDVIDDPEKLLSVAREAFGVQW